MKNSVQLNYILVVWLDYPQSNHTDFNEIIGFLQLDNDGTRLYYVQNSFIVF
jgi:hypothetical protein